MLFQVYWRDKERNVHHGFVKAASADSAYDITLSRLQKGCAITAVYRAYESMITPQSLTINFSNDTSYHLF